MEIITELFYKTNNGFPIWRPDPNTLGYCLSGKKLEEPLPVAHAFKAFLKPCNIQGILDQAIQTWNH